MTSLSELYDVESVNWLVVAARELNVHTSQLTLRNFISYFGIHPHTMRYIHYVYFVSTPLCHPKYILYTFSFLKHYEKDGFGHLKFKKANARTYRDIVWQTLSFLEEEMDEV
jgi:hypothetical protein